jgi:hypothetical protein
MFRRFDGRQESGCVNIQARADSEELSSGERTQSARIITPEVSMIFLCGWSIAQSAEPFPGVEWAWEGHLPRHLGIDAEYDTGTISQI